MQHSCCLSFLFTKIPQREQEAKGLGAWGFGVVMSVVEPPELLLRQAGGAACVFGICKRVAKQGIVSGVHTPEQQ